MSTANESARPVPAEVGSRLLFENEQVRVWDLRLEPGESTGQTDDFSYNVVKDLVHIHDLNATIQHCLGVDHERLTYRFQGRDFRLTDVEGRVVKEILV